MTRQYIGLEPLASSNNENRQDFVATNGQTVFTIGYTPGFLDVFVNGSKLTKATDFTATNGTSFTLTLPCTLYDEVSALARYANTPNGSYSQAQSDAMYALKSGSTKTGTDVSSFDGVQNRVGIDPSPIYKVVLSTMTGGALFNLVGEAIMEAYLHNISPFQTSANVWDWNPAGRDDTGSCVLEVVLTESGRKLKYYAASNTAGTAPVFQLVDAQDLSVGYQSNSIGRNVIVNGGCEVSQVNGTTLITPLTNSYPIDNLNTIYTVASKLQTQQVSNALNSLGAISALTTSVLAQYTPTSVDRFVHYFPIEGLNFARFQYGTAYAKAGSLQFKARVSVAGTYSGAIVNYSGGRSYPFTFVLAANTDTLVTIPNIPGDTAGTWATINTGAAYVTFDLGCVASWKGTAGTWAASTYYGATGATNIVSQVNGSTLTITDVQFEVGAFCTTYERKLYDQVLRECQRYLPYWSSASSASIGMSAAYTATTAYTSIPLPVPSRIPCTGAVFSANNLFISYINSATYVSSGLSGSTFTTSAVEISQTIAGATGGQSGFLRYNVAGSFYLTGAQI
jgi:hypothetical protein